MKKGYWIGYYLSKLNDAIDKALGFPKTVGRKQSCPKEIGHYYAPAKKVGRWACVRCNKTMPHEKDLP